MSLELRKTSLHFYSCLRINGKRKTIPLQQCYEGTPPAGLRMKEKGDAAFERTRGMALKEEEELKAELQKPQSEHELLKRVYKTVTGGELKPVPLEELYKISFNHVRKRTWSPEYATQVHNKHELLLNFLKRTYPKVTFAHQVTCSMAESFLVQHQNERGFGGKTFDDVKTMMQGLWTVLEELQLNTGNPFKGIVSPEYLSITKKPFTKKELEQILEEANTDRVLYRLIVLSASTGMRLKDCCLLRWASVDVEDRLIFVPALKKTQKPATIPLFGELEKILMEAYTQKKPNDQYVFMSASRQYLRNKQYYSNLFTDLLLDIGYTDDDNPETSIRVSSEDGCRRRPIRSFGTLKTTWMTWALRSGVSLEDVKKICGNVDTDVILKHYFESDGERIRQKLQSHMPKILGGAEFSEDSVCNSANQLLGLLDEINGENWPFIVERLREEIGILKISGGGFAKNQCN